MGNPHPDKPFFDDPDTEALRLEIQAGINARFTHKDEELEDLEENDE